MKAQAKARPDVSSFSDACLQKKIRVHQFAHKNKPFFFEKLNKARQCKWGDIKSFFLQKKFDKSFFRIVGSGGLNVRCCSQALEIEATLVDCKVVA